MAGGNFDINVAKVRPGTYVNFQSVRQEVLGGSERGTVIIPLGSTDWGPAGEMLTITPEAPDANFVKLGYSVYDTNDNMLMIREALKGCSKVIVYICTEGTTVASGTGGGLTGTAKYKGARGNSLKYVITANPVSGFDVDIYLGTSKVEEFKGVATYADLAGSEWIIFAKSSEEAVITATTGVTLTGGTNGSTTSTEVAAFLTACEGENWDTMAFPFTDSALKAAVLAKIQYLHDNVGRPVQATAPNFAADYEGIINVTNSYGLDDGTELTTTQACAYVAGITAGADAATSNTYKVVAGAVKVVNPKTTAGAEAAITAGEFFFSMSESGNVVCEYDINSLTTIGNGKDSGYKKNKIQRVFAQVSDLIRANFPPNRFNNDPTGWTVMEGIGKTILKRLGPTDEGGTGTLQNIDYDNDFKVDKERSTGDSTYFNVGIQPVDSAEKLYFTISTR